MNGSHWLLAGLLLNTAPLWAGGAEQLDPVIPLPEGETSLGDVGIYRVGWQSYGKEAVWMPDSWMGHFEPSCGISYIGWGRVLGREALLMHSPWLVPPGKTWVDYELALPQALPIRLSFGIAMGPDVAVPGRSDGVTFACFLTAGGQERELMRKHHEKAEWLDYSADLSPYAGKKVTLRLQVEPGPKNNAGWDYSFFGDAKLTVGQAAPAKRDVVQTWVTGRPSRATENASRTSLSNRPGNGVTPSNLLPHRNRLEATAESWRFVYEGADCRVVYAYSPASGTLDDFMVQVDDGRPFAPAHGGGATVLHPPTNTAASSPAQPVETLLRGGKPVEIRRDGENLLVRWRYEPPGGPIQLDWTFRLVGKSLVVSARCKEPRISRFTLGEAMAPLRKTMRVPYLHGHLFFLPVQRLFTCRYLDWTASQSSLCPQGTAVYEPKTDGARNPLFEAGYVAVSPDVGEVLPNVPHPPSPYLSVLGPKIMLDIWGHQPRGYAGDAAKLRELKDNGVDHLVIIQHDWQRHGYDVKLPDHLPANPAYGGDEGMKAFGQAANDCGYLWSLHENYIDLYPDAPSYDAAARVLLADGLPSKAWYNPGTKVQSFGLKCNRALGYARQNSPEAHRRYRTTAAYLDVHTCVPPWHQLDHEAGQPLAAMQKAKVRCDTELFQFERDTHGGPLFGEGANHFYWAGRCDGVEAQVEGGENHTAFLDFDLFKIHPQMVNHGMGYYERWYRQGYDVQYGLTGGSVEQWDKYRAMEVAYGHAGFLGHVLVHNVQAVAREHHLMHPVQRLYGTARPTDIRYEVAGRLVTASAALAAGDTTRQRIRYENGLVVWVNWRPEPWAIEPASGELAQAWRGAPNAGPSGQTGRQNAPQTQVLPQWGFLALGPQTEVGTTLRQGRVADYAQCPEFVFADARTWFDLPYLQAQKDIEPRLREFKFLGGDRAEVTYEWVVNDTLEANYNCFVHATTGEAPGADRIVFQGDHGVPKPTSQWRRGEVIVDGPHQLRVSGQFDHYDLVIGLFQRERVRLKGLDDGSRRILIGQIKVDRKDGRIVSLAFEHVAPEQRGRQRIEQANFAAHTNPAGTWVDFGSVATDGALKINRESDRLVIFPYPREKRFRASLDLKALAPAAEAARVQVRALASGNQADLGLAGTIVEGGRLVLTFGTAGAGRYVVTWKQ